MDLEVAGAARIVDDVAPFCADERTQLPVPVTELMFRPCKGVEPASEDSLVRDRTWVLTYTVPIVAR